MKKIIEAVLATIMSAGTMFPALPAFAENDEERAAVGRIAETVMQRRQDGLSLQSTLDTIKGKDGEQIGPGFRQMIMDAYGQMPMSVQKNKDRLIGEFRDAYQLLCMKQGK